ncbi:CFEM domain-containing protein [Colletotrichum tofieldiae]|uniref:CFEM domain-containing protein n=1 Tax=Colletotrichum tofieldiae TaxID=708197 RepID=A0A166S048_9PEZI|nr:CFEM domain-containing protein [Colletotrichum tofieldiae]GKT90221.1 CFEM domain-containing protein [Colletotrichum tofieldiae]
MQFIITLGLLSGLAAAQSATTTGSSSGSTGLPSLISQLPTCAISCLNTAASNIGCETTDFSCLCSSQDRLISSLTPCILTAGCSTDDIAKAARIAPQICSEVENNPAASDIASASNLVTGALGTATGSSAATATATPAAAARPTNGYYGILGAGAVALAAVAL